jgi:peptidoglycan/LPS O-acetylase OafA/YrhL
LPYRTFFAHTWSLCVEEHFYLALPLLLIIFRHLKLNAKHILGVLGFILLLGFALKVINYIYFHEDHYYLYYTASHNRIDALGYGVFVAVLIHFRKNAIQYSRYKWLWFTSGLLLLFATAYANTTYQWEWFRPIFLHTFSGLSFALIVVGSFYSDFKKYHFFRVMGYYSYNWYLWHMWVFFFFTPYARNMLNLLLYVVLSFMAAVFFTRLIEEPFLNWRKRVLS